MSDLLEREVAALRLEVADADERAGHYYGLLMTAEAETERLAARVRELEGELRVLKPALVSRRDQVRDLLAQASE